MEAERAVWTPETHKSAIRFNPSPLTTLRASPGGAKLPQHSPRVPDPTVIPAQRECHGTPLLLGVLTKPGRRRADLGFHVLGRSVCVCVGCGFCEATFADHRGYQSLLIYVGAALQSAIEGHIRRMSVAGVRQSLVQWPSEGALRRLHCSDFLVRASGSAAGSSSRGRTTTGRPVRSTAVLATNNTNGFFAPPCE